MKTKNSLEECVIRYSPEREKRQTFFAWLGIIFTFGLAFKWCYSALFERSYYLTVKNISQYLKENPDALMKLRYQKGSEAEYHRFHFGKYYFWYTEFIKNKSWCLFDENRNCMCPGIFEDEKLYWNKYVFIRTKLEEAIASKKLDKE